VELNVKKAISTHKAPIPVGPYSQAIQAGNFLFVSGQLAINPKTGKIDGITVTEQTRQVIKNLNAVLSAADFSLADIVQTTVYLSSMKYFEEFNHEYAKYFSEDFPARATVACELKVGAYVELAAVAYKETHVFDNL
jgi:2-iminobutanoate/2-iminopropanoate deaminase